MVHRVRLANRDDAADIGRLLYDFHRAFDGPAGLAVLRFRAAIWSSGFECYLAELYVAPASRGQGLGRALMEAALSEARLRGADSMDIGVDEPDTAARRLYESLGFPNRVDGGG